MYVYYERVFTYILVNKYSDIGQQTEANQPTDGHEGSWEVTHQISNRITSFSDTRVDCVSKKTER